MAEMAVQGVEHKKAITLHATAIKTLAHNTQKIENKLAEVEERIKPLELRHASAGHEQIGDKIASELVLLEKKLAQELKAKLAQELEAKLDERLAPLTTELKKMKINEASTRRQLKECEQEFTRLDNELEKTKEHCRNLIAAWDKVVQPTPALLKTMHTSIKPPTGGKPAASDKDEVNLLRKEVADLQGQLENIKQTSDAEKAKEMTRAQESARLQKEVADLATEVAELAVDLKTAKDAAAAANLDAQTKVDEDPDDGAAPSNDEEHLARRSARVLKKKLVESTTAELAGINFSNGSGPKQAMKVFEKTFENKGKKEALMLQQHLLQEVEAHREKKFKEKASFATQLLNAYIEEKYPE